MEDQFNMGGEGSNLEGLNNEMFTYLIKRKLFNSILAIVAIKQDLDQFINCCTARYQK